MVFNSYLMAVRLNSPTILNGSQAAAAAAAAAPLKAESRL